MLHILGRKNRYENFTYENQCLRVCREFGCFFVKCEVLCCSFIFERDRLQKIMCQKFECGPGWGDDVKNWKMQIFVKFCKDFLSFPYTWGD